MSKILLFSKVLGVNHTYQNWKSKEPSATLIMTCVVHKHKYTTHVRWEIILKYFQNFLNALSIIYFTLTFLQLNDFTTGKILQLTALTTHINKILRAVDRYRHPSFIKGEGSLQTFKSVNELLITLNLRVKFGSFNELIKHSFELNIATQSYIHHTKCPWKST